MTFIENLGYTLLGFIIIVSVFLLILAIIEKKLLIRLIKGRTTRNQLYIDKIAKLDINKPKESLIILDNTTKNFFKEAFHVSGTLEYSEFQKIFKQKNNKKAEEFSRKMTNYLYSNKTITPPEIQELIRLIAEIISSNKIIDKEERKRLDQRSLELDKTRNSGKIHIPGIGKKKLNNKKNDGQED